MPAIQPARLKHQTAQLTQAFDQPAQVIKVLHHLLNFYADHTQRPGQGGEPTPLIETYHVPQPVLREIHYELKPFCRLKPQSALALCQQLWLQPYLEFRLIACALLGEISSIQAKQVLQIVGEWLSIKPEDQIMQAILDKGLAYLRHVDPGALMETNQEWLSDTSLYSKRCGLWSLFYLATDPGYNNLPEVFRILIPVLRALPSELRPDILTIALKLAHHAPQETAFLLRQNMTRSDTSNIAWLTRQVISEFPQAIQDNLRESLKSN